MTDKTNLMTQKEAAAYLGTTVGSLNTWRATAKHKIPYVSWGRCIRYHREELDAWIAEHSKNNISNTGILDASEVRTALRNAEDSRYGSIDEELPAPDLDLGDDDELSDIQA